MRPCYRVAIATLVATVVAGVAPSEADAHLVTTGLGPIYDGMLHLFASPEDLLAVLAISVLGGLNGARAGRHTVFVLTAAWLVAGLLGMSGSVPMVTAYVPVVPVASLLVLGTLVAIDRSVPLVLLGLLALLVGAAHGFENGLGIAEAVREPSTLAGITVSVFVTVSLVAGSVVSLRSAWSRIALRVLGSWVAAIGLLLFGWTLRGAA